MIAGNIAIVTFGDAVTVYFPLAVIITGPSSSPAEPPQFKQYFIA